MQRGPRRQIPTIKRGASAEVIRAYKSSTKFDALARSTRVSYGHLFELGRRPDTLVRCVGRYYPTCSRGSFLDGFADRPAQQKCAQTALKAVEKWALVRDMLPFPITVGTQAPGGTGGHVPWTEEQVAPGRDPMLGRTWRE